MELTEVDKEFLGKTLTTPKGGILTVRKVYSKEKKKKTKYTCTCSICSQDRELWEEDTITITKSDFAKGVIPCGCSPSCVYKEWQRKIIIQRLCDECGYIFHGWYGDFKGGNTYLDLENPKTNNHWYTTSINSFLRGRRDPIEGINGVRSEDFIGSQFMGKNGNVITVKEIKNRDSHGTANFVCECSICSKDKELFPYGSITSTRNSLVTGSMPCGCCSFGFQKSKPVNLYIVKWYNDNEQYIKFGITNRKVETRIKEQSRISQLNYEILYTYHNKNGKIIYDLEKYIKNTLQEKLSACPKELMEDGYTETITYSEENVKLLIDFIKYINAKKEAVIK